VRAVLQALGRLHRKEDLSAVMTVFHVQKEKSVMRQVIFSTFHSFKIDHSFLCFPSWIAGSECCSPSGNYRCMEKVVGTPPA